MKGYYFDKRLAEQACEFFPRFLRLWKGRYAGRPFELQDWQKSIVRRAFGWISSKTGFRRYRTVWIEIPKKNGKSTFAGGLATKLTAADHEPGAEVYSAAASAEQARMVYDSARMMVENSPKLRRRFVCTKQSLYVPSSHSTYKVISSLAATKHGLDVHGIVIDELHAHSKPDLVNALQYGTASRDQPMTIYLTTAGVDRNSIGYQKHDYALRILRDPSLDPTFLPVIYAADPGDDWQDPRIWKKANPGYGISPTEVALETAYREAMLTPVNRNIFRQLHLNQWMQQHERAIDLDLWKKGATPIDVKALYGRACWGGLDLASKRDLASLSLVFPLENGGYIPLVWNFVPGDNVAARVDRDHVPYNYWSELGFIEQTPGDEIAYDRIRERVNECGKRFDIRQLAFDRWDATSISQQLAGDGFEVVRFGQGYQSMNEPSKEFDVKAHNGGLLHGGNPVFDWAAGNLVWAKDAAGNYKPDKKRSIEKIDPVTATVMGMGICMARPRRGGRYERGGGIRSAG